MWTPDDRGLSHWARSAEGVMPWECRVQDVAAQRASRNCLVCAGGIGSRVRGKAHGIFANTAEVEQEIWVGADWISSSSV